MKKGGESRVSKSEIENEGSLHGCVGFVGDFFEILTGLVRG